MGVYGEDVCSENLVSEYIQRECGKDIRREQCHYVNSPYLSQNHDREKRMILANPYIVFHPCSIIRMIPMMNEYDDHDRLDGCDGWCCRG